MGRRAGRGAGRGAPALSQLLSPLEQGIDDPTHVVHGLERGVVGAVLVCLVEHYENVVVLVEDAVELGVQDHLGEFPLHLVLREPDRLRDVAHLCRGGGGGRGQSGWYRNGPSVAPTPVLYE